MIVRDRITRILIKKSATASFMLIALFFVNIRNAFFNPALKFTLSKTTEHAANFAINETNRVITKKTRNTGRKISIGLNIKRLRIARIAVVIIFSMVIIKRRGQNFFNPT